MLRRITIATCLNGFIVEVGCQTLAYSPDKLLTDLGHYLRNPEETEQRIIETEGINRRHTLDEPRDLAPSQWGCVQPSQHATHDKWRTPAAKPPLARPSHREAGSCCEPVRARASTNRNNNTAMHYIVTDTETGGLYPSTHALLSIGACCTWSPETFLAYITVDSQPGKSVSAEAIAKNGYSAEKWEALGARPIGAVMADFLAWIDARKKERHAAKIVCHNLAFDRSFFMEAENVTGHQMPHRHDWRCSQVKFGELMDLGILQEGSTSLDKLIEWSMWDDTRTEIHNALQDAQATQHGYLWLLEKAKGAENTLRQLYTQSLSERRRLEALIIKVGEWMDRKTSWDECGAIAQELSAEAARLKREEDEIHG